MSKFDSLLSKKKKSYEEATDEALSIIQKALDDGLQAYVETKGELTIHSLGNEPVICLVCAEDKTFIDIDPTSGDEDSVYELTEEDATSLRKLFNSFSKEEPKEHAFVSFVKQLMNDATNDETRKFLQDILGEPMPEKVETEYALLLKKIMDNPKDYTYAWSSNVMSIFEGSKNVLMISFDPAQRVNISMQGGTNYIIEEEGEKCTRKFVDKIKKEATNEWESRYPLSDFISKALTPNDAARLFDKIFK